MDKLEYKGSSVFLLLNYLYKTHRNNDEIKTIPSEPLLSSPILMVDEIIRQVRVEYKFFIFELINQVLNQFSEIYYFNFTIASEIASLLNGLLMSSKWKIS